MRPEHNVQEVRAHIMVCRFASRSFVFAAVIDVAVPANGLFLSVGREVGVFSSERNDHEPQRFVVVVPESLVRCVCNTELEVCDAPQVQTLIHHPIQVRLPVRPRRG